MITMTGVPLLMPSDGTTCEEPGQNGLHPELSTRRAMDPAVRQLLQSVGFVDVASLMCQHLVAYSGYRRGSRGKGRSLH